MYLLGDFSCEVIEDMLMMLLLCLLWWVDRCFIVLWV